MYLALIGIRAIGIADLTLFFHLALKTDIGAVIEQPIHLPAEFS